MQAYMQCLPDKMKKERCVCVFCCRTAAISAPFTPPAEFRFHPLSAISFLAIDVDITFHYVTSQFSAFSSALVGSALLGDIDARKSRRSQISLLLAALLAGFAVLPASMCSHPRQPAGAGGKAMG
jgi:hypothetical protein